MGHLEALLCHEGHHTPAAIPEQGEQIHVCAVPPRLLPHRLLAGAGHGKHALCRYACKISWSELAILAVWRARSPCVRVCCLPKGEGINPACLQRVLHVLLMCVGRDCMHCASTRPCVLLDKCCLAGCQHQSLQCLQAGHSIKSTLQNFSMLGRRSACPESDSHDRTRRNAHADHQGLDCRCPVHGARHQAGAGMGRVSPGRYVLPAPKP